MKFRGVYEKKDDDDDDKGEKNLENLWQDFFFMLKIVNDFFGNLSVDFFSHMAPKRFCFQTI